MVDAGNAEARDALHVACAAEGAFRNFSVGAKAVPAGAVDEIHFFVEGHFLHDQIGTLIRRERAIHPRARVGFRRGGHLGGEGQRCKKQRGRKAAQEALRGERKELHEVTSKEREMLPARWNFRQDKTFKLASRAGCLRNSCRRSAGRDMGNSADLRGETRRRRSRLSVTAWMRRDPSASPPDRHTFPTGCGLAA